MHKVLYSQALSVSLLVFVVTLSSVTPVSSQLNKYPSQFNLRHSHSHTHHPNDSNENSLVIASGGRCKTKQPTEDEMTQAEKLVREYKQKKNRKDASGGKHSLLFDHNRRLEDQTIETVIHVILDGTSGMIEESTINAQMQVLNDNFAGSGFVFLKKATTYTENASWYNVKANSDEEILMKSTLRQGNAATLNVYIAKPPDTLGWSTYPNYYRKNKFDDGVVLHSKSLPSGEFPYDEGKSLTHEVGHWLGLYHTFQGGCQSLGDHIDDTPAQSSPTFGCPKRRDSCKNDSGKDPIHNYMDYSYDSCLDNFSAGQKEQMEALWFVYRHQDAPCTNDADCDDGRDCNGKETCDGLTGTCSEGSPPSTSPTTVVTINLLTDWFASESYWVLVNDCTGIKVTGGGDYDSATEYNLHECFDDDTNQDVRFTFTMGDFNGDGMVGAGFDGSYSVEYNGEIVAQGGAFQDEESTTFGTCGGTTIKPTTEPTSETNNCESCGKGVVCCGTCEKLPRGQKRCIE